MNQSLLIVEDDEATRSFLADNLAADGYAVAAAAGAAEGIRQIEVRHPALVLLDLGLEEGHGLELLDRVRAADGMGSRIDPELPVIVITGRSGDADRVRGFARGADDFVIKPFLYQELLGLISRTGRKRTCRGFKYPLGALAGSVATARTKGWTMPSTRTTDWLRSSSSG